MGEVDTCDASYAIIEYEGEKEVEGGKWEEQRGGGGGEGEGEARNECYCPIECSQSLT